MAAVFAPSEATLQETSARLLETAPEMFDLEPKTSPLPAAILENLECDERGGLDDSVAPVAPAELGECLHVSFGVTYICLHVII